jgi:hypothetical protein
MSVPPKHPQHVTVPANTALGNGESQHISHAYEPPGISLVGHVRDLVKGSSSSGKSDANSQYYW